MRLRGPKVRRVVVGVYIQPAIGHDHPGRRCRYLVITLPRKKGLPDTSGVSGLPAKRPLGSICIAASKLLKKLLFVM